MAEDSEEPEITLGDAAPVEGAPPARVAERLTWGIEKSEIDRREGETLIRTPDGPQELSSVLTSVDRTYFATSQEFEDAIRSVIGWGPIPVAEESDQSEKATETEAEAEADADTDADADADAETNGE